MTTNLNINTTYRQSSLNPYRITKINNRIEVELFKSPYYNFTLHVRCYMNLKRKHNGIINWVDFVTKRRIGSMEKLTCTNCCIQYELFIFFL